MKKSIAIRPVSKNAYTGFVERINLVFSDAAKRESMLVALDRYLEGETSACEAGLSPDCAMAFAMLKFDIDMAIARSARARSRARKSGNGRKSGSGINKTKSQPSAAARSARRAEMIRLINESDDPIGTALRLFGYKVPETGKAVPADTSAGESGAAEGMDAEPAQSVTAKFVAPKSRRQRRSESRMAAGKSRWRKL